METIPLLPAGAPHTIAPTDIAQYIRLDQCGRYLRLRLHERLHGTAFMRRSDVAPQSIPPILTRAGNAFEQQVEQQISAYAAQQQAPLINCRDQRVGDDTAIGAHNALLLQLARELPAGGLLFLLQPRLRVTLGAWDVRGDVDLLRLQRNAQGELAVLVADIKSSTAARVEHRLQVAFYHEMLATLFASAALPCASITTAVLYRGPTAPVASPPAAERLQQEAAALALFGVSDGLLELVAAPESYRAEVADLVVSPDSVAAATARTPFEALPFHLNYKCDGCLYNEFCLKWSAEHDDLSLLPHLADHEKNALRAAGITTTSALAALKTFRAPPAPDLVPAPGKHEQVRRLANTPRLGARLDELIHRARRYRASQGDALHALSYIPSKGQGSLPFCDAGHNPNLVRVYIDAQHDYQHDRVYMLGALIAPCEDGAEQPERRRSIVRLTAGPPTEPAQEQALLVSWIAEVLAAIATLAAPDAEGQQRAPIHLIFFNSFEQRLLLDALARHFGAVAGATPLYDFVTQLAAFDSPVATFLDQEVRLKNYPMVCQSLQALARHLGFSWNSPAPYSELFRTRMFDDQGRLDDEGAWYTSRARFGSQIPLEYAYAAWDELPTAADDNYAAYRGVTPELLQGFHARRLEAMEHIARDFRGNWQTEKSAFDLSGIAGWSEQARTLADALGEFLTLERHARLGSWKRGRLAAPEQRMLAGETLVLRYSEADQAPELLAALHENARRRVLREQYRAAYLAANPGKKQVRLNNEQKAEVTELELPAPYRLRIDLADADCDLPGALALSTLRPGDTLLLAPRTTYDERLPPEQRQPLTPTAKQLLYAARARLLRVDASGLVELELSNSAARAKTPGYVFPTMEHMARPLTDGTRYTLDPDPNDWYGAHCAEVVAGLRTGQPNTLYSRLAHPEREQVDWPADASASQERFAAGLEALHQAGALHAFDAAQQAYIGGHGAAPTLLVQGPPGTGKSYATAFALLARLQGALAANRHYRVLLACKTHAATNVLLEKLAEVQTLLATLKATQAAIFETFFDARLLDAPLLRLRPNEHGAPAGVRVLTRDDDALGIIDAQDYCFVGATPAAVRGVLKDAGEPWGHEWCDCLVLDEASQANLPEACMAALPLRLDGQLIVVGDHRQMPPIIAHGWGEERRRTFQEYRAFESLFVTLLKRNPTPPIIRFAESFRLHTTMASFLREEIYTHDGIPYFSRRQKLLDEQAYDDPFVAAVLRSASPLVVVVHEEAGSQVANPFEQALVIPLLTALAQQHGLDYRGGLGVVVPHRAQRAALQAALPGLAPRDPATGLLLGSAIDTVERFQGGERRAILVSATESDRAYLRAAGEFLLDPRRLNVALSRAKEKLILVAARTVFTTFSADEEAFANAQIWKNLLRRACTTRLWAGERHGVRVEVWGNQAEP